MNYYKWSLLILLLIFIPFVSSQVTITNLLNNSLITTLYIDYALNISGITNLSHVNYTTNNGLNNIMHPETFMFFNFDNRSALGENYTYVADIGNYHLFNLTVADSENSVGKYGRAFYSNGTLVGTAPTFTSSHLNSSASQSYCFWIKAENEFADPYGYIFQTRNLTTRQNELSCYVNNDSSTMSECGKIRCELWNNTAVSVEKYKLSSSINDSTWHHFCIVVDSTSITSYTDGKLTETSTFPLGAANLSNRVGRIVFNKDFNGSLDDFIGISKALNSTEVNRIYRTSITKYTINEWNITLYNERLGVGTKYISFCGNNITNSLCAYLTIRANPSVILTLLPSQIKGIVNQYFYGINIQNPFTLVDNRVNRTIDLNNDGVTETEQNYTWQRETFANSGMDYARFDASVDSWYSSLLWNKDFEDWGNLSMKPYNVTVSTSLASTARGDWSVSVSSRGNCTIGPSTDALSGTYSLNITSTSQSGSNYIIKDADLRNGHNYSFSFWAKGNGSFATNIRQGSDDYTTCNFYSAFSVNSTWQKFNMTCNASSAIAVDGDYDIVLVDAVSANDTILIDNLSLKEDGIEVSYYRKFRTLASTPVDFYTALQYLNQSNKRMLLIMDYMPNFLANYSTTCIAANTEDTDTSDCMANDWNTWRNLTIDFMDNVTNNGQYNNVDVEVWNEPYGGFFLDQLTYDNITIANYYVNLYNQTRNAIKSKYPSIGVGGPSGYVLSTTPNNFNQFFIQIGNNTDFISYHPYDGDINGYLKDNTYNNTLALYNNCTAYGLACSKFIASEWQPDYVGRNASNAQSPLYKTSIAEIYLQWLNNFASIHLSTPYHWDDTKSYFNNPNNYNEYPSFWSAVSHAGLDNAAPTYYPLYNITKQFATYHPALSSTINSTSDSNEVVTTASRINNVRTITAINKGTDSVNLSLSFGENITTIYDNYGNIYTQNPDGIFYVGVLNSYEVKSFYGSLPASPTALQVLLPAYCNSLMTGPEGFFSQIGVILGIFAVFIILIVLVAVVNVVKDPYYNPFEFAGIDHINGGMIKAFFALILGIALLIFVFFIMFGSLCNI